ncbi:SDR family oxidoreductase [Thermaurantiacus sp.]|uniref:SDR family oxidoreductase n=1 Tax=Thermaurantiacus sp. TaxID=2820283 RepID=UPI00298F0546|nr:SDR family oxidoreductase [Thermaurantiacus sp.]
MSGRLAGKVAIVKGGAMGLGEANCRLTAAEGARVVVAEIDPQGEEVARAIGGLFVRHDVTDEAAWVDLVARVERELGALHVLVNNAGVVAPGTPEAVSADDLRRILAVSLEGVVWGTKHALPSMRRAGSGSIINMASIASVTGEPYVAAYAAAKGAVEASTRATAVHCAQRGDPIRANSVYPAGIDTPVVRSMGAALARAGSRPLAQSDHAAGRNPLGRPEDVAHRAVCLASDRSAFVSGRRFVIDRTASITQGAVPPVRPGEAP